MAATLTVHDHLVHFYHLHALDWVSPLEALKADPTATANLQNAVLANYKLPLMVQWNMIFCISKRFPKSNSCIFPSN